MSDLKIELTKLYGLHKACTNLEHAVRDVERSGLQWQPFAPSRFIYAFFTFNGVYSYDWETSFQENSAIKWKPQPRRGRPYEKEQFESMVKVFYSILKSEAPIAFIRSLDKSLRLFNIANSNEELEGIVVSNETKRVRELRKAFPTNYQLLYRKQDSYDKHCRALLDCLFFIYAVRNNVFHGSKTRIQMEDESQQSRLLIYTAILIAANNLLFEVAVKRKDIGWKRVPVTFAQQDSN